MRFGIGPPPGQTPTERAGRAQAMARDLSGRLRSTGRPRALAQDGSLERLEGKGPLGRRGVVRSKPSQRGEGRSHPRPCHSCQELPSTTLISCPAFRWTGAAPSVFTALTARNGPELAATAMALGRARVHGPPTFRMTMVTKRTFVPNVLKS